MAVETTGQTQKRGSSASRKIRWLSIAIVVVVALYSAGWFFVASEIERVVAGVIARPGPVSLECADLKRAGTPFRIGFDCSRTSVKDDATGAMVSAGAIRAVAHIFNPGSGLVELDGPANVSMLDGNAITANWSRMRAGFSVGLSSLKSLSVTGEGIAADIFNYAMVEPVIAKASGGEFHIRGNGADIETAVLVRDFAVATRSGTEVLPQLSTSAMLTLKDKAELLEGKPLVSKAMTGQLTSFKIETPEGLYGEMTGPFEIDADGYISGQFQTKFEKISLWQRDLNKLLPGAEGTVSGMAALLKGLAKGGDSVTVNLVVNKGAISLSMMPLGRIPPI